MVGHYHITNTYRVESTTWALQFTPIQTEKNDENKSFAVDFTFLNVFKWLVEPYSFIRTCYMRPCRPRDRPGQTCGGSPVTGLKHVCNTGTRSVRLSHQHIQRAG